MTGPDMETITASLERSMQNCSLNQTTSSGAGNSSAGVSRSSSSSAPGNHHQHPSNSVDTALELNSQISLPYHWEQCLDLQTGEIYYINWRTGMKAKEDPRTTTEEEDYVNGDLYSDEEDDDDDDDDDENSSYDSEGSTTESSPSCSRDQRYHHRNHQNQNQNQIDEHKVDHVLVVAGCKSCLMYFMVPKQVEDCPKCCGQLLHFDRSENGSP